MRARLGVTAAIVAALALGLLVRAPAPLASKGDTAVGGPAQSRLYSTSFPTRENPLSENSAWLNGKKDGIDWNDVRTVKGFALLTKPNISDYRDSTAIVKGAWGPNQYVRAMVHMPNPDTKYPMEFEIRVRTTLSANYCAGYEIIGGQQVVRWNGPLGNFTILPDTGPYGTLKHGDLFEVHMVGNVITVYINGVQVNQAVDNTYTTGNPGIGFFSRNPKPPRFGFSSFAASDAPF